MKKLIILAGLVLAMAGNAKADVLAYWDFNTDDSSAATGTLNSRVGGLPPTGIVEGTATVRNATYTFASSSNDDPRVYEQSALRMTTFPGTTTSNKTAGAEFRFSTVGYESITASYLHNNSATGGKYWRVQYTLDGATWVDHQVLVNNTTAWRYFDVDFGGIAGADNNPNFGFRIVAEWESTATGKGTAGYVANTGTSYNTGGTFWMDIVTVSGNPIDASNTRPTISTIATQETTPGVATTAIPFTVWDAQDSAGALFVEWSTVGADLVQDVVLGGSGGNRTITVIPTATPGTATITLKVTDSGGKYAITSFPLNIRPTIPAGAIAYWDFNSSEQDSDPATGTLVSRIGSGTSKIVTAAFAFMGSASGLDPWTVDNSCIRMNGFPAATVGNKTAGIEFRFSTVGYENVSFTYDHNNGNTGSRYWRAQYTADGVNWLDHVVITNAAAGWFVYTVDFSGIRAADNNPNFGVRLVSEFESTATGTGEAAYVQSQTSAASYTTSGTFWVDRATFNATPITGGNTAPTIAVATSVTGRAAASSVAIPFTVADLETAVGSLVSSWSSPTPTLVASASITGTGANRTLNVVPSGQVGTAELVLKVADAGGRFSEARVSLALLPANTPPQIGTISPVDMLVNSTSNVVVTVTDLEQNLGSMVVSIESSNPGLLSSENVTISGTGTECTLAITPAAGKAGGAWVTVTVSDGEFTASTSFMLKVQRPQTIALWNFNSPEADNNTVTGTLEPAIGSGRADSVGTATNSLGGLSAASFDPALADDTKWRFGSFPAQGEGNKTSGAEFMVSTVGYKNIALTWDHYNSATGSRYWRLQYTLDGSTFTDFVVYTNPVVTTFRPAGADFSGIPGAENNPNFGVRLVSEFESTATGQGAEGYVATSLTSNYGTGGTLWLDMVSFTGEPTGSSVVELQIVTRGNEIEISWPAEAAGVLQGTDNLGAPAWQTVSQAPAITGGRKVVVLPATGQARFFRLGSN
jgi:hypothetical protein